MQDSIPDSIEQLLASIKQEYGLERGATLSTEQDIKEHCRSFFEGQVFLSHTSKDYEFCRKHIVPVLAQFGLWSYFFMSIGNAHPQLAMAYRFMVEYSLFYCKTIIFAVSEASARSDWVRLEASWAIEQRHPRIICLLDHTAPEDLHAELAQDHPTKDEPPQQIIPFYQDIKAAQATLNGLLYLPAFAPEKRTGI